MKQLFNTSFFTGFSANRIIATIKSSLVVTMFLAIAGTSTAQSLSDWENAARQSDCESIPYNDLRSDCNSNAPARKSYCNESTAGWNGRDPRKLQQTINDINSNISNLKQKKNDLDNEKSRATDDNQKNNASNKIKAVEDDIRSQENKIDQMKRQMSDEISAIKNAISDAERCLEVREYVYKLFDKAIAKAQNETDPKIKPIAQNLISRWQEGQRKHTQAISDTKTRISNLKSLI